MKRKPWHLLFLLLGWNYCVCAQEVSKQKNENQTETEIELIHADRLLVDERTPAGASKLLGNVELRHQEAFMYCDSAYLFENNSLKAYGHVKIEEGDSLIMTGDSLFYDGNERLAKVRGDVTIDNKASILKTHFLDYYRETSMGHYYGGGIIDSEKEKLHLVSDIGYYFSESQVFHFKRKVVMDHPDYHIVTDTMHYAPNIEKTWFFGPTDITFEQKNIYCEFGWFDQLNDLAKFIKNARIESGGQIMSGDTIEYFQADSIGIAKCNVALVDTNEKFEVTGDYAIYHEKDSTSYVTRNMMLKQDMEGDTFFLTADTLYSITDTAGKRIIKTFHDARFYKSDMQGACDSLIYHTEDSIIYLYHDPILWSDQNQITADSIHLTMEKGTIHRMYMDQKAFIISAEDSVLFSQIKGRNMVGYFRETELRKVDVFGNGETIYYPREEDSTLIGVNETKCANMTIRIDSNDINAISFYDNPEATLTPTDEMPKKGILLDGFVWRIKERPQSKEDLIIMRLEKDALPPEPSKKSVTKESEEGQVNSDEPTLNEEKEEIEPPMEED